MKLFLLALAIAAALTLPARAATEYMLNYTQWQRFDKCPVAGPFETYAA